MHGVELLAARLIENADRVDAGLSPAQGPTNRGLVTDIGLDHLDLTDVAHEPHRVRQMGLANGHADAQAALRERPHNLSSDEARSAKDRDQILHVVRLRIKALKTKGFGAVRIDDADRRCNATYISLNEGVDPDKAAP